jgi:hypothetical protein
MTLSPLPEHQRVRKFRHPEEKYDLDEPEAEAARPDPKPSAQSAPA